MSFISVPTDGRAVTTSHIAYTLVSPVIKPVDLSHPLNNLNTFKAFDENGDEYTIRVREDIAIAFQHELDHLNGILFTDRIDPKNPFKGKDSMREI